MAWPSAITGVLCDGRLVVFAALLVLTIVGLRKLSSRKTREPHQRGALVGDSARRRRFRVRRDADGLTVADIVIPALDETKHFKFIGTTGTGKSTAIRELLAKAIQRGDRAVFADPDGGYCRAFYQRYRGDIVLNPFEAESLRWDLFDEIQDSYDAQHLASGLIPDCEDASAREWRSYARTLLAALIRRCTESGQHSAAELWRLLTQASAEELRRG